MIFSTRTKNLDSGAQLKSNGFNIDSVDKGLSIVRNGGIIATARPTGAHLF